MSEKIEIDTALFPPGAKEPLDVLATCIPQAFHSASSASFYISKVQRTRGLVGGTLAGQLAPLRQEYDEATSTLGALMTRFEGIMRRFEEGL